MGFNSAFKGLNILHISLTVDQIAGSRVTEINVGRGKTVSAYAMKAFGNIEEYFYQPLNPAIEGGKR